jgi:phage protein D
MVVEVEGAQLDASAMTRLLSLVVDQSLHKPDMFVITFADDEDDLLRATHLQVGSRITVSADGWTSKQLRSLIEGEVTAIEAAYDSLDKKTVVRGYDRSHRLHRGSKTATYRNVKDSDIAQTVAKRLGCEVGTIDDSGATLDHVAQFNQTDWEFLSCRAREIGFEMSVEGGRFNFRKPVGASTGPDTPDGGQASTTQLTYGFDLLAFRPRMSAVGQPGAVQVRAWDPTNKQVIVGQSSASSSHVDASADLADVCQTFGDATHAIVDRPIGTQDEADRIAAAGAEQAASSGFEADGTAIGNPDLRAGVAINISGVAKPFGGRYSLTETRHVFEDGEYLTHFGISGRRDRSLLGLASGGQGHMSPSAGGAALPGVVIGQVTDNDDPDQVARVKVKFPWLSDSYETDWCRVCQLGAGPDSGAIWLPEVNDEVLLAFEFGDIRRPYVVGSLYNGQDKPSLGDELFDAGKLKRRGFVSRTGHRFIFFDDSSNTGVALLSADSSCRVSLNQTSGEIHIHCSGQVTIDTDSGDVNINAGGDVSVKAQGSIGLNASTGVTIQSDSSITIQSDSSVSVSAPSISLGGG